MRTVAVGRVAAVVAVAIGLTVPAGASGATQIGAALTEPAAIAVTCQQTESIVHISGDVSYAVPASGGVIVRFFTAFAGTPGTPFKFRVWRPQASQWEGVGTAAAVVGLDEAASVPARIPVVGGDLIGLTSNASGGQVHVCKGQIPETDHGLGMVVLDDPADGVAWTPTAAYSGVRLNAAAILEPDGDGDGFGDESQDECLADAADHQRPCAADLNLALTAFLGAAEVGALTAVQVEVANPGPRPADGITFSAAIPAGLELVEATPTQGSCEVSTARCELGELAAGGKAKVLLLLSGLAPGSHPLAASVASAIDPDPTNDSAEALVEIAAPRDPPAVTPAPIHVLSPVALCRVPRLKGRTRAGAARALAAASCRLGKVRTVKRERRRRVRSQSIPAGTRVVAQTRVHVLLRGRRVSRSQRRATSRRGNHRHRYRRAVGSP